MKMFQKKYGTIGPTKEHSKKKSSAKIYNIARLIPATRLILRNQITITAIPKNKNLIRKISSYFPVRENINKAYFRAHPKAVSVSKKIGQKEFDKFFKFSVVRNPYDHAVSYYHFLKKNTSSNRHSEAQSWTFEDAISYLERKNKILPVNQKGLSLNILLDSHKRWKHLII